MAMGKRKREQQPPLFVGHEDLPQSQGHPFYVGLNQLLKAGGFDEWVEEVCVTFYKGKLGRPSMAPGVYFRCLLVGYFEGIGSERGIAWRVADSLSLRSFLGLGLTDSTPDHSTLSRTRRLGDRGAPPASHSLALCSAQCRRRSAPGFGRPIVTCWSICS